MIIIAGPGQGAQTPGFLAPWLDSPAIRDLIGELSEFAQLDLTHYGTIADADTIRDTAVAQPLIVAAGLVAATALYGQDAPAAAAFAGHSIGEITAAALAGVLDHAAAMTFVRVRSTEMAKAAAAAPTGMSAVLTRDIVAAESALAEAGLTAANYNGAGQLVAAGPRDALMRLAENPPSGARVIPLTVAGAFHTRYMGPAQPALAATAEQISVNDPIRPLYSNRDGQIVASGREYVTRLVEQVSSPVRWDLCQRAFADADASGLIELAPAGTLTGLARRTLPGVTAVAVKTPDDLEKAQALLTA